MSFVLDRDAILKEDRVTFVSEDIVPIGEHLDHIEKYINECYIDEGYSVVQSGRVVALRYTDKNRKSSAFKAGTYLGKYHDLGNTDRFLKKMVSAGHSYEPIRGENILFLFIGVGKPVYDHLVTYGVGRTTRIAGGQRANLPWGYEMPSEMKGDVKDFMYDGMRAVENVVGLVKGFNEDLHKQQMQAARSLLPVGYIMPPFLLEFSEEALITNIFTQRIFEPGAQGATVDIAKNMWDIVMQIDPKKWLHLYDYHGPHIQGWKKAMRTIRDKEYTMGDLVDIAAKQNLIDVQDGEFNLSEVNLYDILMQTVGKLPLSMWDK